MKRNDYDIWRCSCGATKKVPSVPHDPPEHCGTTMWWHHFETGLEYEA